MVPLLRLYSTSTLKRSLQMPRIAVTEFVKATACTPSIFTFAGFGGACTYQNCHELR